MTRETAHSRCRSQFAGKPQRVGVFRHPHLYKIADMLHRSGLMGICRLTQRVKPRFTANVKDEVADHALLFPVLEVPWGIIAVGATCAGQRHSDKLAIFAGSEYLRRGAGPDLGGFGCLPAEDKGLRIGIGQRHECVVYVKVSSQLAPYREYSLASSLRKPIHERSDTAVIVLGHWSRLSGAEGTGLWHRDVESAYVFGSHNPYFLIIERRKKETRGNAARTDGPGLTANVERRMSLTGKPEHSHVQTSVQNKLHHFTVSERVRQKCRKHLHRFLSHLYILPVLPGVYLL